MGVKIKKLYLKNFKVYDERLFDFDESSLIVFDGPNGFGKTSIYDAIELIFTGRIRRYQNLMGLLIDGRERRNENPMYHYFGDNTEIVIKVLFEHNGVDYILARVNTNLTEPILNFTHYKLYLLNSFEEKFTEDNLVNDDILSNYFGANYKSDFEFINYIEQEDTLSFLKSSEKTKKEGIEYLFNTLDFNEKIRKFEQINNCLREHLNGENGINAKRLFVENSIKEIQDGFKTGEETSYERIFLNTEIGWDKEEINFDQYTYKELFDPEEGILSQVDHLLLDKTNFLSSVYNERIDNLLEDEDSLEAFYKYEYFQNQEARLTEERDLKAQLEKFEKNFVDFKIDDVSDDLYDIPELIKSKYPDNQNIITYDEKLLKLKGELTNSNLTSRIYAKLITTRDTLLDQLKDYHRHINDDGNCPLCGADWKSSEKLIIEIEEQKEQLERLNASLDKSLNVSIEDLKAFATEILIPYFNQLFTIFIYESSYFESDFFNPSRKIRRTKIRGALEQLTINYKRFISETTKIDYDQLFDTFKTSIIDQKRDYNPENISEYYHEIFEHIFESKEEILKELSIEKFRNKTKYLTWHFSIHQSELIKKKSLELEQLKSQQEKILSPQRKIENQILPSLKNSLKWYNDLLIKDIELLFHIYSGRIVQDFQGGLGLFIVNNKDKIKFVTSPQKTYDAVFSMSTGQLSALALSFTLALNKKYSTSKLLFVDDPIQAMDDINAAGFVEVLRNDFADRQIFFSTHEYSMSTYIRYKFKKFGLESKRIDLSHDNV
jgi:exonuclease SbcC